MKRASKWEILREKEREKKLDYYVSSTSLKHSTHFLKSMNDWLSWIIKRGLSIRHKYSERDSSV